jgi:hypothetical protein
MTETADRYFIGSHQLGGGEELLGKYAEIIGQY